MLKGIILAAGTGSRLCLETQGTPKCLVDVGGQSILARQIDALRPVVDEIVIVVGHQKEAVIEATRGIARHREYDNFACTNNLHTLWSVRDELTGDFCCVFADVLLDPSMVRDLVASSGEFRLLIDMSVVRDGTMRVTTGNGRVTGIGNQISLDAADGNFTGVALIRQRGAVRLLAEMDRLVAAGSHQDDYYTLAIDRLARSGVEIPYLDTGGRLWAEVDTYEDLQQARALFPGKPPSH